MTSLASCQVSVLDDDRVFPRLFNTDSRRTEVSQELERKGQSYSPGNPIGFSKDNNELQGCALCFYFMMLICEVNTKLCVSINVTINCIVLWHMTTQWNTMQQVGGSTWDPDGVYIPSIHLPSTDCVEIINHRQIWNQKLRCRMNNQIKAGNERWNVPL